MSGDTKDVSKDESETQDKATVLEAAKTLSIGRKTIYRWIDKGLISKIRERGKTYVSLSEIRSFMCPVQETDDTENVSSVVSGDTTKVVLDREHYEGLLIRLGQLESEKRYLLEYKTGVEEKDRELEKLRAENERLRTPWLFRFFKKRK